MKSDIIKSNNNDIFMQIIEYMVDLYDIENEVKNAINNIVNDLSISDLNSLSDKTSQYYRLEYITIENILNKYWNRPKVILDNDILIKYSDIINNIASYYDMSKYVMEIPE